VSRLSIFCWTLIAIIFALIPPATLSQDLPYRPGFGSQLAYQCKAYVWVMSGPHRIGDDAAANQVTAGSQCRGYVEGFVDGINSEDVATPTASLPRKDRNDWWSKALCIPPGTVDTWIKVYIAFMDKNPKYLDEIMGTSLRAALHETYPCPK